MCDTLNKFLDMFLIKLYRYMCDFSIGYLLEITLVLLPIVTLWNDRSYDAYEVNVNCSRGRKY